MLTWKTRHQSLPCLGWHLLPTIGRNMMVLPLFTLLLLFPMFMLLSLLLLSLLLSLLLLLLELVLEPRLPAREREEARKLRKVKVDTAKVIGEHP